MMASTPPPAVTPPSLRSEARLRSKPSSSLCLAGSLDAVADDDINHHDPTPPPRRSCSTISPSPFHLSAVRSSSENHVPLRELLLLSSSPPVRRHRPRIHVHADAENVDPDATTPRRRCKNHRSSPAAGNAVFGTWCSSPRNARRSRRRLERDILTREEREPPTLCEEEAGRLRRPRRPCKATVVVAQKEFPSLAGSSGAQTLLSPVPSEREPNGDDGGPLGLDGMRELVSELVLWKDPAKSCLWFGLGTLCFASSCFSRNINFNFASAVSHVGLLVLALAFFWDTFSQRFEEKRSRHLRLKEEDFLKVIRLALPAANAAIRIVQDIFSGEPSMTIKVAPLLFFATRYGHLLTVWRLMAAGFFLSFTVPRIYSSHTHQIHMLAESAGCHVSEAWRACRHKRAAALTAGVIFWKLLGLKTRVFAAFFAVVMLRYRRQQLGGEEEGGTAQDEAAGAKEEGGTERIEENGEKEVETFAEKMDLVCSQ